MSDINRETLAVILMGCGAVALIDGLRALWMATIDRPDLWTTSTVLLVVGALLMIVGWYAHYRIDHPAS